MVREPADVRSYANSVLQALYFCAPLREAVMEADAAHVSPVPEKGDTLHASLVRLFHAMARRASRVSLEVRRTADADGGRGAEARCGGHAGDLLADGGVGRDQVVSGDAHAQERPV